MSAGCERGGRHELAREIDLKKSRRTSASEFQFGARREQLRSRELRERVSTSEEAPAQVDGRAHEPGKLAAELTLASERALEGDGQLAAGGRAAEGQQQQQQQQLKAAGGKQQARRAAGLLEALLGERGRNWFEHRPVVLNIQNGARQKQQQQQQKSAADIGESFKKLQAESEDVEGPQNKSQPKQQQQQQERVAPVEQQRATSKYARLPTFGSVPQRLETRAPSSGPPAPYLVYHGRARRQPEAANSVGGRLTRRAQAEPDRNSVTSSGRLSSASTSTSQATSSAASSVLASSRRLPGSRELPSSRSTSRSASRLGFSNISNLFPGEPVRARQRTAPSRSASLLDLAADKRAYARQQHHFERLLCGQPDERLVAQQRQRLASQPRPASAMMRQRAGNFGTSSSQQLSAAAASSQQANVKANYAQQARSRPASATGNYLGGAGGRRRSPGASYRLGSAGMSPLIDPDCPVHGDELGRAPPAPLQSSARGRSYEREAYQHQHQADFYERRAPAAAPHYAAFSASQPDLLYGPHEDPYNLSRPVYAERHRASAAGFHGASPVYSPMSPIDYEPAGYERARGGGAPPHSSAAPAAYYDNSTRFSLYHPTGDGAGTMRASLAPAGEQLRRILGYKPASAPAKPVHLHPQWAYTRPFIHLQPAGSGFGRSPSPSVGEPSNLAEARALPHFAPFNRLQDSQAIRAVDFHPSGEVYAVGSNSRALRICAYPAEHELRHFEPFEARDGELLGDSADEQLTAPPPAVHARQPRAPRVLFKFLQLHRGSIYCVAFNPSGRLLATGSNDQTVHIAKYNAVTHNPDGEEFRLTMHNGTVRDLCFIDDSSGNGNSLLLSAGGGDNKIFVTDCDTVTPFQSMAGHTQMVMALGHCGGAQFVSGSYDRTIRFWDLRARSCTSIVSAPPQSSGGAGATGQVASSASGPGAAVCALRVDPSGRLLASGHTDSTCMLYDIRGAKIIQTFRPHDDELRAISFSPKSYYLLTGGYDGRLVVSDLQGDLTQPLPSVCVAESQDKIVQAKWHPADFTFVATSADKSATLWSLPGEIRT